MARRLTRAKSNLGPDGGRFEYHLVQAMATEGGQSVPAQLVDWGAQLEGTARDLLGVEEPGEGNAISEAGDFLAGLLAAGPVKVREVEAAARAHGHSWRGARQKGNRREGKQTGHDLWLGMVFAGQGPRPPCLTRTTPLTMVGGLRYASKPKMHTSLHFYEDCHGARSIGGLRRPTRVFQDRQRLAAFKRAPTKSGFLTSLSPFFC